MLKSYYEEFLFQQAKVYVIEKAKQAYDKLSPLAKKIAKGTKEAVEKVYNVVDDPFYGPAVKIGTKNVIGTGVKYIANADAKKQVEQYQAKVQSLENKLNKQTQIADSLSLLIKNKPKTNIQTANMTTEQFLESVGTTGEQEPDFNKMTVEEIDAWLEKNK